MKKLIAGWMVLTAMGCGETVVDMAPIQEAQQKIERTRKQVDDLAADAKAAQQSVMNAGRYSQEARAAVDRLLASGNERIQEMAQPILAAAVQFDPASRREILAMLERKAQDGSKKAAEIRKSLEELIQAKSPSPTR